MATDRRLARRVRGLAGVPCAGRGGHRHADRGRPPAGADRVRYIRSLFLQHPTLAQLVTRETGEALELSCRVVIEVTTASFRTSRGYYTTQNYNIVAAVIADELAYWIGDEDGANPALSGFPRQS